MNVRPCWWKADLSGTAALLAIAHRARHRRCSRKYRRFRGDQVSSELLNTGISEEILVGARSGFRSFPGFRMFVDKHTALSIFPDMSRVKQAAAHGQPDAIGLQRLHGTDRHSHVEDSI